MPWKKEIEDKKKEIETLKNQVNLLTTTVHTLQHDILIVNQKLDISSHVNNVLRLQLDDLQQYTRRYSILLDNIAKIPNVRTEDVEAEVKKILVQDFNVDENKLSEEFDKAHRLGMVTKDNTQSIVVRFKSHSFRSNL